MEESDLLDLYRAAFDIKGHAETINHLVTRKVKGEQFNEKVWKRDITNALLKIHEGLKVADAIAAFRM